jgi:predicted ferric reductase
MTGSPLWYASRGAGVVSLVLLTGVVLLGILHRSGRPLPGLPRFVVAGLHRNISVLALIFLALHILTAVADSYVSISLIDVIVPFGSAYRPFWLGLGAVALDLIVALIITSLLRAHLGHRTWRALHWAGYAVWPIALTHGLGVGSDIQHGWLLALTVFCAGLVAAAMGWRWWTVRSPEPLRVDAPVAR